MFGLSRRLIYAQEQSSFDPTGCLAFSYVNSSLRPFMVRSISYRLSVHLGLY